MEQAIAKLLLLLVTAGVQPPHLATVEESAVNCLAMNIYHEARSQSIAGQIAVGQVTLNRVNDDRFPNTICEVVTEGPHRPSWKGTGELIPVRHRCQFSWYCDGKSDSIRQPHIYKKIRKLANILIREGMVDITSSATHYHAYYVQPAWAKTKRRTTKIEDHIFYKWEKK
tara:strand:+ start:3670 stop:4179 length:510 start_codon:yes stop_codon:yes gene_type:complete